MRRLSGASTPGVGVAGRSTLALAALGVVFGDIGTSPLYAMRTVFALDGGVIKPSAEDVYGVISLIFWSATVIVSVKYLAILTRADNEGEGGVMALTALGGRLWASRRPGAGARAGAGVIVVVGIVGVALFYGDSVITPAISVLSAVEGLQIAAPGVKPAVLPIAVVILAALFAVQRYGTGRVGSFFGPVMLLWFAVLALTGITGIVRYPAVLVGLSPTFAVGFVVAHPFLAFVAMGAVVLVVTGAEALYADMGHFGRRPIARAWFAVVFPALMLNYLGQAALILNQPEARLDPFFLLFPSWATIPVVVLATAATVIASQAVISGAFSLSRQAMRLGLLPPLTVRQTSQREGGQIYLPAINLLLFVAVLAVTIAFASSASLATAYGVSVTGALLVDTVLLLVVSRMLWRWRIWKLVLAGVAFGTLELLFLAANLSKVASGGWLPLLIAAAVVLAMTTWQRGRAIVQANRRRSEGSLAEFVEEVRRSKVPRVRGVGVFPHPDKDTTPLALRANFDHNHVLHEHVVIVSVVIAAVPHVPVDEAFSFDELGYAGDGIEHLTIRFGFSDEPDIPAALRAAARSKSPDRELRAEHMNEVSYFVSRGALRATASSGMPRWRTRLFLALAHNAADPASRFGFPPEHTVTMGSDIGI
ncbi:MAG: KUP/HAK/KT family potassium transporter [Micrococcales bacterium]|nr:KUP/HAK/KT family potassium transporter [Micrococcales bacterium]